VITLGRKALKQRGGCARNCASVAAHLVDLPDPVVRTLREIVAPLVEADGGVLYVVRKQGGVRLHLAGACAGCPGYRITSTEVIEPALRAAGMSGDIDVTAGWTVPDGAERVTPAG
jgi:Fe-S cluster biogenesis protein NfuA